MTRGGGGSEEGLVARPPVRMLSAGPLLCVNTSLRRPPCGTANICKFSAPAKLNSPCSAGRKSCS